MALTEEKLRNRAIKMLDVARQMVERGDVESFWLTPDGSLATAIFTAAAHETPNEPKMGLMLAVSERPGQIDQALASFAAWANEQHAESAQVIHERLAVHEGVKERPPV